MKRILAISLAVVVLLVIAGWVGLRLYLHSAGVLQQVTDQVSAAYGGPASLESVNLGFFSSTLHGLRLFEPGADPKTAKPILTADAVTLDVPLWHLARGIVDPSSVDVNGARVAVHFDDAGNLLTRLPMGAENKPIPWHRVPRMTVAHAALVLQKGNHHPITIDQVQARVMPESGRIILTGGADAPIGKLALEASVDEKTELAQARVSISGTAHVTHAFLESLPLLPASLLSEIDVEQGNAQGALSVSYDLATKALHYRIDLDAADAKVYLPALAITVQNTSGKLIVDDDRVQLRSAKGQALGGLVYAQGELTYDGPILRLKLSELKAEDLDVDDVPGSWGIPDAIRKSIAGGKLFGTAKVDVTLGDVSAISSAAATLMGLAFPDPAAAQWPGEAALVAAFPGESLRIDSKGRGEVRDPTREHEPIQFDWQLTPHLKRAPMEPKRANPAALLATMFFADPLAVQEEQPKDKATPNDFDLKFNLKNASLAEIVKNEGIKLPFAVDGKISVEVKASIPLDELKNLKAYKAHGVAQIADLVIAGARLDKVTADFDYNNGVLAVKSLKSALADNGGSLSGEARVQIAPLGEVSAQLAFDKVPLARVAEQKAEDVRGTVSGSINVRGDAGKLPDPKALTVEGKIAAGAVTLYGLTIDEFATGLKLKDGLATFPGLQVKFDGALFTPTASAEINSDHAVLARISLHNSELQALRKIAAERGIALPAMTGTLSADAKLQPKPAKGEPEISGDIEAKNLKIASADIEEARIHWAFADSGIVLGADLYGGKLTGLAALPKGKTPGKLDVKVQDLNVGKLARDLGMPFAVEGRVAGSLKAVVMPATKKQPAQADIKVDFKSPILHVQNIPAEQLQGDLHYQAGKITYKLTANSLGGTIELEGAMPATGEDKKPKEKISEKQATRRLPSPQAPMSMLLGPASQSRAGAEPARLYETGLNNTPQFIVQKHPKETGRLTIRGVRIGKLLEALGAPASRDIRGTLNIDVAFTQDTPDRYPEGGGSLRIGDVRFGQTLLSDGIRAEIVLANRQLRIRNLSGDLAQGTVGGYVIYNLREPERSEFALNLDAVETKQLLAPWLEKKIEGPVDVRLRGKLGRTWTGTADVQMARGKLAGLAIADGRVPIIWSLAPSESRAKAEIHDAAAQLASGRASGKLSISWDHGARVDGQLRLDRCQLGDLLRETVGQTSVAAGRTTAKVDIQGSQVRSLADLSGNVVASFEQAQALQVPVLQQIAPFLGLTPSTTFHKGNLVARLDRGTINIKQLSLQGNTVQVFIDGSVTLREQLNLHVIAKTGNVGWPALRLGPISVRVPIAGPVPLVLVQEVSTLLSNHVVYLDVSGTPQSPVIRPQPLRILTSEAVRFFLNPSNSPVVINP